MCVFKPKASPRTSSSTPRDSCSPIPVLRIVSRRLRPGIFGERAAGASRKGVRPPRDAARRCARRIGGTRRHQLSLSEDGDPRRPPRETRLERGRSRGASASDNFDERYSPRIVATMNDCTIEVVKVEGEFVWQSHPETDDCFLVLEGEARDRTPRPHGAASEGRVVRRATRRASSARQRRGARPLGRTAKDADTGDAADSDLTAVERTI